MQKANCGSVGWNGAETGRLEPSLFPAPRVCIRFQAKGSQWVRAAQESRNGKAGPPVPVSSELIRSFLNRELIRFKYVACVDLRRRHSRGRLCHRAGPAPIPPNEWSGDCQHRQKTHLFMELTDPETELDGVQTGVWNGQSGVGDVHILERKSGVIAAIAEWKVHSDAQLWREIDRVRAEWDIVIGDKDASTELGKGNSARRTAPEVVLNVKRSEAYRVGILQRLAHKVDRNCL